MAPPRRGLVSQIFFELPLPPSRHTMVGLTAGELAKSESKSSGGGRRGGFGGSWMFGGGVLVSTKSTSGMLSGGNLRISHVQREEGMVSLECM